MKRIAIIGFGCAGYKAAEALRSKDREMQIDVFSNTDLPPYNPMLTTYYLSGKISWDKMFPFGSLEDIEKELNINLHENEAAEHLDVIKRTVFTGKGSSGPYDDIIICTGARPVVPEFAEGIRNVYTMRSIDDVARMDSILSESSVQTAVVAGAQMVGIKVAEMLSKRGVKVLLTGRSGQVFPRSACPDIAEMIQAKIADHGIEQLYGCALDNIEKKEKGVICSFADGRKEEADICCICTGIKANIPFLEGEDIVITNGIDTGLDMQSSVPHIYAAGDCCNTPDIQTGSRSAIGLWANSFEQGQTAAMNILGQKTEYRGNLIHNLSHFLDMDFISIGNSKAEGEVISYDAADGKWHIRLITDSKGEIVCLNILDNIGISGPLKAFAVEQFTKGSAELSDISRMKMLKNGIPEKVIEDFCRKVAGDEV